MPTKIPARKYVLTGIGKDRPGIVSKVTQALFKAGCNIEDSSMTILEGEFTMTMIVASSRKQALQKIKKSQRELESKFGLLTNIKPLKDSPVIGDDKPIGKIVMISVAGDDKPGIVYNVSRFLASQKINICDLNSKVIGEEGASNGYIVLIEAQLPKTTTLAKFRASLKEMGRKKALDVSVQLLSQAMI